MIRRRRSPPAAAALSTLLLLVAVAAPPQLVSALDNGRARLPPLGWSSWNQYRTKVNETHVRDAAAALVSTGLAAKGWRTVVISDGWPGGRDSTGRLFGNRERFPNGMKALCQYINSLGLECGIYNSMGNTTCGGFAGGWRHEELDAATYVDWPVQPNNPQRLGLQLCSARSQRRRSFRGSRYRCGKSTHWQEQPMGSRAGGQGA